MSDSGDERPKQGRRRGNSDEKELATQQVVIQQKRFYIDVKENQRGRFIKLAEVGAGGRRSRILMTMSVANEFKQRLIEFSELHSQMGPSHGGNSATTTGAGNTSNNESSSNNQNNNNKRNNNNNNNNNNSSNNNNQDNNNDGLIKSETIVKDRKRYYLDLKENQRGRFLRVSMVVPRGPRAFLAIPAQGLIEFKDHLSDMIDRYGAGFLEEPSQPELPESKSLRADRKLFYFDCGSNARGVFVKISEVKNRYRSSITISDKFLGQFRDLLNEYVDKVGQTPGPEQQANETKQENKQ